MTGPQTPDTSRQHGIHTDRVVTDENIISGTNPDNVLGAMLNQLSNREDELTPSQNQIRDLVYSRPGHFFGGHNLEVAYTRDNVTYTRDAEFIERVVTERETGAAILNGIILNSADEPEGQEEESNRMQNILEQCGDRLDQYYFSGRHSIDDLAKTVEEKKLLAKMIVASAVTHAASRDDNRIYSDLRNIEYCVMQGLINASEIVQIQNLVIATVESLPENRRPPLLDLARMFINITANQKAKEDTAKSTGRYIDTNGFFRAFQDVKIVTRDRGQLVEADGNTSNDEKYVGKVGEYRLQDESPLAPKIAHNRLAESIATALDYRNLVIASKSNVPDYASIIADSSILGQIERANTAEVSVPDLEERILTARTAVLGAANTGASRIDSWVNIVASVNGDFNSKDALTQRKGFSKVLNESGVLTLDYYFSDGTPQNEVVKACGVTRQQLSEILIGKGEQAIRNNILAKAAELSMPRIAEIKQSILDPVMALDDFSPLETEPVTRIVDWEKGTILTMEQGRQVKKPIIESNTEDIKSLGKSYALIAERYKKMIQLYPAVVENLNRDYGIRYNPDEEAFEFTEPKNIRNQKPGVVFLIEVLNKFAEISKRGSSGSLLAEALEAAHVQRTQEILGREVSILRGVASVFPTKVSDQMVQVLEGPLANSRKYKEPHAS